MMGRPIAVATPMLDPAADARADLRLAAADYIAARHELAQRRAELARKIHAARRAGLSHRQIAAVSALDAMTALRLEKEAR